MSSAEHSADDSVLEWDETGTPFSRRFNDVYYSRRLGLAESRFVFLQHNQLAARFAEPGKCQFVIGETGFGTGLNFLACWQLWRQMAQAGQRLHYISIEKYPLSREQLARCLLAWPELTDLTRQLLEEYPPTVPGTHHIALDNGAVYLDLIMGDVATALAELELTGLGVDAWFLDGFAPARNPAMWTTAVMQSVATLSKHAATVATFTAAGQVRRNLQAAGFTVEKVAGFGRKREMLRGEIAHPATGTHRNYPTTPWFISSRRRQHCRTVAVIGAGLAGSHIAAQLARRNIAVTVFEQTSVVASGASGNPQAVLYARLSAAGGAAAEFGLSSYLYAGRCYRQLFREGRLHPAIDGELSGSLQLSCNDSSRRLHDQLAARFQRWPALLTTLDTAAASQQAGVNLPCGALWLPQSGWLAPVAVCKTLLAEQGIELQTDCQVQALHQLDERWDLILDNGSRSFDQVVIANSTGTSALLPDQHFPIKPARGQVTVLPWPAAASAPRVPICHEGYITPASNGTACIGATFDLTAAHSEIRLEDHQQNLAQLEKYLPEVFRVGAASWDASQLDGRASVRATTTDYLPIVGPVPDIAGFSTDYAALARNARQVIPAYGNYQPGLFVCTGLGSRGLTYAPLAAALVCSYMLGEPLPLHWRLARATHPARFLARAIGRGQALTNADRT